MKSVRRFFVLALLLLIAALAPGLSGRDEPAVPVKIALVSNEKSDALRNILTLAETKLTEVPGIQVLEREAINRILAEQKLSLSGLVATDQILSAGKLLGVDLFAVLEAGLDKKDAAGQVVFDARTGVRLWDAALQPGELDAVVAATVDAIQKAQQKRRAIDKLRTVCLMTVRNADLPRDLDSFCDSVGLLLERHLIASPNLALLERRRLEQVNQERNLPIDSPLHKLLASVVAIELEIGTSPDGKGLKATALLSDGKGKSIGKTTAVIPKRDAAALARAIFKEMAESLNVKAAPAEGGRVQEAGRFLREAEFFWEHKDPKRALPAAESAVALHPDDPSLRVALARGLLALGSDVLDPGDKHAVGSIFHKVDPKILELSLDLTRRGSDRLIEAELLLPEVKLTPSGNVHKMIAAGILHSYLQKVGGLHEGVTPAGQEGIDAVRFNLRRIQDVRFERSLAGLKDKASFDEFTTQTNQALMSVLDPAIPPSQWVASLKRLRLWAEAARKFEDVRASSSRSLLSRALFSYRYPRGKLGAKEIAELKTFWAELEDHPNLTIAVYARLGSMANALALSNPTNEERLRQVRAYRLFVQDHLAKGAKEPAVLRLNLYLAGADGIDQLINLPGYAEEKKELCEFMLARKELAPTLVQSTAFSYLASRKLEGQRYAYDLLDRALAYVDGGEGRFLTYAESPAVLKIDRDRFRKEFLRMQSDIRLAAPSIGPPPTTPWKTADNLIDVYPNKDGIVWLQQPVVHKGAVYVAAIRVEGTPAKHSVQLLRLTPGEGKWEGRKVEVSLLFQPWAGTKESPFRLNVSFGTAACVHENRYYLGTKKDGIFAFPFDDGIPERITTAEGLPSDQIQALTCLGGRLFAYLGEANKESYIVAWNLQPRKCEVLASSRRKEKRSPFDDNTPLVTSFMLADPAREQVLFSVFSPFTQHALNGVWAFETKKNAFSRLFILHHGDLSLAASGSRVEGDKLLLPSTLGLFTYDLVKNDQHLLYANKVSLEVGPQRSALYSLGRMPEYQKRFDGRTDVRSPYLAADGWLWAAAPFSRQPLAGGKPEHLAPLRSEQRFFEPNETMQLFRGERDLLVGDAFGLWLLTLPERK
jgi:hypothetical protein